MATHYHAMNGEHGCMPDSNDLCETYADAVQTLVDRFELGRKRAAELRRRALAVNDESARALLARIDGKGGRQ